MSVVDSVFIAVPGASSEVADWLVAEAGCEVMATERDAVRLRMRAHSADDWLGIVVQPNGYVLPDPEPDEVQAMDGYPIEVQIRGGASDDALHREAGLLFDTLVAAHADVPMLLVHNLETLVTAHLPGAGTHTFTPPVSPDAEDLETWHNWIRT
ncbi:hypothetical protein [Kribbella pratensis]|jgi:hypothetical protein|uniref:Uncharacterized protein n=1 Tax=Kribbella pratensis TaxID=2512112 RepID=A0A4R8CPC2_9ACTN|nr:hypothetical protein [Kribbella pratensis]TDW78010.1 hypothetical protein EV653_3199 [Kribbella pratensis]